MHSRAYLLLEREYLELKEADLHGIFVTPVRDNLLEWIATVQGLKDSIWEGAIFQLSLKYTDKYNNVPPCVTFNTIPFHPNVNKTSGKPCIDFLDKLEEWNTRLTMTNILLTIQVMLSNPIMENPVNLEAAEMQQNNPLLYRKVVFDCVRASKHLNAGIIEDCTSTLTIPLAQTGSAEQHFRKIHNISFEDYHMTWSEIATTKVKIPVLRDPTVLWSYPNFEEPNKKEVNPKVSPASQELLGNLSEAEVTDKNLLGMNEIKPTYQCHITQGHSTNDKHEYESWEEEVDYLVAWTNTLSSTVLED
uniref:Ubiquitin-conjugating enzyme E2 U isoform X2 n=1 Tax=Geotrypetes seraphini TaxID=260995 RepID=A0A6P8PHI9_GEOSA|nr:ubiquitin-conjugating enzyme E2 U isoform X2 [Geotrypetes seraphini]